MVLVLAKLRKLQESDVSRNIGDIGCDVDTGAEPPDEPRVQLRLSGSSALLAAATGNGPTVHTGDCNTNDRGHSPGKCKMKLSS
jgi:hypothetical protein